MGGSVALISALLSWLVSPWWLILTAVVGFNLIIFAATGFCLMAVVLSKLGAKPRLAREK
ncbi:MAG TPA: YgaP-like transmembrane domain [Nitrospirota bacterium]|nr:YgaP-like transmembrane domain [Nitrospirota bacterium]